MTTKLLATGALTLGLIAAGCDKPAPPAAGKPAPKKTGDHADHGDHGPAPHGGTVVEFGKYHAEFVVDHAKKEATVYVLDGDAENPAPVAVAKLLLSVTSPRFQTDLAAAPQPGDPAGTASRFVATHDHFAKEQEFAGTISGEIDGKPYAADFKDEAHAGHDHGKK